MKTLTTREKKNVQLPDNDASILHKEQTDPKLPFHSIKGFVTVVFPNHAALFLLWGLRSSYRREI